MSEINFNDLSQEKEDVEEEYLELSDQAVAALQMALIQCLKDQSDIVPILKSWKIINTDQGLVVTNPNSVEFKKEE